MDYIPHTETDRQEMLRTVGVDDVGDLFHDVPEAVRFPSLDLPKAASELEILQELEALGAANVNLKEVSCFLGAGAYNRFIPSVVDQMISRSEFYTAYTPYQPEIAQGTLQAMYEYQSMICALTGMEVANGSHYDGATSAAEAVIMALNVANGKRRRFVLSPTLHPHTRQVIRTYTQGMGLILAGDDDLANAEPERLASLCDGNTAAVLVQNPDFLGQLYAPQEMQQLADAVKRCGALLVVSADPVSLGLFTPPGEYGADIVVGEGQALGNNVAFGGPYLGIFACNMEHVRRSAGRIAGETVDEEGRPGYVLTLNTREQHIRRGKATSNICTNQALNMLAAAVYLSSLGKRGLRQVADLSYQKAHYTATRLNELEGYEVLQTRPFFDEFVVRCSRPVAAINRFLIEEWGILGGYDLEHDYPTLKNHALLCVTEMVSREEVDDLVEALVEAEEAIPSPNGRVAVI